MFLILLLVAVALLAYYLAQRNVDKKAADTTRQLSIKAREAGSDLQDRVKDLTNRDRSKSDGFITWATGAGRTDLPEEFNTWFASMDRDDQKTFSKALNSYVDGLGMSLTALTSGQLDKQPDFKSVFVETLVIYSNAYRKIADAKAKPKTQPDTSKSGNNEATGPDIQTAEKAPSRRSPEPQMDAAPAAS